MPEAALAALGSQNAPENPGPNLPWQLPVTPGFASGSSWLPQFQVPTNLGACQFKQPQVAQQARMATTTPESVLDSRVPDGPIKPRPLSYHSTF